MEPSSMGGPRALAAAWLTLAAVCGAPVSLADTGAPAAPVADAAVAPAIGLPPRTIAFAGTPYVEVGALLEGVVVADFDGDGKPDLAAVAEQSGVVGVVLGRDGLTSSPARTYPPGDRPRALVSADFDGDGRPDLAVVAEQSGVSVLLGNGDGSFQAPLTPWAGDDSITIVTGDFDGDGRPDLAVAGWKTGEVNVLLGTGRGAFRRVGPFPSVPGAAMLLAADLDRDGRQDLLVVARDDGAYAALLGRGDGTFAPPRVVPGDPGSQRVDTAAAVGDFDGDGTPDLAMTFFTPRGESAGGVAVLLGRGDSTFRSGSYLPLARQEWPMAIAAGDLDGDGKLDLAVGADTVFPLLGNGDGTFRVGGHFGTPAGANAIAVADLDGDGKLDLATGDGHGALSVLLGKGDGSFRGERDFLVPPHPERIVTGDVNGDGVPDVVVASDDGVPNVTSASDGSVARVTVLLGDGHGGLVHASERALGGIDAKAGLELADVNGDGKLDLVCARGGKVLLGRGDGSFGEPRITSPTHASDLVLGDFHGRGVLDLVQLLPGAHSVWLSSGHGDGGFLLDREIDVDGALAAALAVDLDGDGKLDLAVSTDGGLRVLFGRGDGTFDPPQRFDPAEPLGALAMADLDGDGRIDLVAARADRDESVVLMNAGGRGLRPGARLPVSGNLALRDLDGDGVPDLAALKNGLGFFHGNGDGTFAASSSLPIRADAFVLADFDRDSLPDLLVLWPYQPILRLFDNHSR